MNPELAVLYAKLDIYEKALKDINEMNYPPYLEPFMVARDALDEATKLSQPASQPEKP